MLTEQDLIDYISKKIIDLSPLNEKASEGLLKTRYRERFKSIEINNGKLTLEVNEDLVNGENGYLNRLNSVENQDLGRILLSILAIFFSFSPRRQCKSKDFCSGIY